MSNLFIGAAGSILGLLVVASYKWLSSYALLLNSKWSLRLAQRDLALVRELVADPAAIPPFFFKRIALWLSVLSGSLMLVPIALTGGSNVVAPIWFGVAAILYVIALHTAAIFHWVKHSDKFTSIIEKRIEAREAQIALREAKAKARMSNQSST